MYHALLDNMTISYIFFFLFLCITCIICTNLEMRVIVRTFLKSSKQVNWFNYKLIRLQSIKCNIGYKVIK